VTDVANPELFRQIYGSTLDGMLRSRWRSLPVTLLLFIFALLALIVALPASRADGQAPGDLVGTFAIAPGGCAGTPSGSYFRMVHPTGTPDAGPYIENLDSTCGDATYTLLSPGTDGGLVTGGYQPPPSPGFDAGGNSLANRVIQPVRFFGVAFSASTNPTDLQTGQGTSVPTLRSDGGRLSGDLSAYSATWNDQAFNQGGPKPGGSRPGNTTLPSGTFDAATGAFSLTWTSQIVGGAFNNFTGVWHLEGTFRPAGAPPAPAGQDTPGTTVAAGAAPAAGGSVDAAPVPGSPEAVAPDAGAPGPAAPAGGGTATPAASVQDDAFSAPTWLVLLLAAAGIGGVITLLVLGPRSSRDGSGADRRTPAVAGGRRWPLRTIACIGIGLALAPLIFQMFTRAPGGGRMIDDFEPHMEATKIGGFVADLDTIDTAQSEAVALLANTPDGATRYPQVARFTDAWPAIDDDMSSMLTTMDRNIGNYRGVAALPPFALFPWFFVIPGVLLAGVAVWSLRADGARPVRGRRIALVALGIGLIAAPAVFQMFSRAPGGAEMIDDFRPFMRPAKVTEIQGYFLTIGTAEAELRLDAVPALAGGTPTPAIATLNEEWPRISNEMAPMIGTMADNVDRFDGIAALPPFSAFPWFFVVPGVLVLGLVRSTRPTTPHAAPLATLEGKLTPT
jgi:hypothetical protein